jgi:hypothetical protein
VVCSRRAIAFANACAPIAVEVGVEMLAKSGGHAVRSAHVMGRRNSWRRPGDNQ